MKSPICPGHFCWRICRPPVAAGDPCAAAVLERLRLSVARGLRQKQLQQAPHLATRQQRLVVYGT